MDALLFVLALAPIIWLVVMLLVFKWSAWKAAIGSFVISCVLGALVWSLPAAEVATASLEGFLMALWPIIIVIIAAVFTYNLCVSTGAMDVICSMITSISNDRRLLALLIAWCFGGFMEGMAGFGTAVAIPAGILAGFGFEPLAAVLMCLISNGVPTPFGSIGIPTVSLANLLGMDAVQLAAQSAFQLAPFYVLSPFLVVLVAGAIKGEDGKVVSVAERFSGVVVPTLASGLSFALVTFVVANFVGAELAVVIGSIAALGITAIFAQSAAKKGSLDKRFEVEVAPAEGLSLLVALKSWSCFIIIFVLLLGTSKLVPALNSALAPFASSVQIYSGANPNTITFTWINTPGVWIMIAALVGGAIQGAKPAQMAQVFGATVKQMMPTVITMLSVLGCAKVMSYSGMISSISAFCIAVTGVAYPVLAPWIGALGTFVTGSGTSSGLLFGSVQTQAAEALGLNRYWMASLNSLGVAAGKMLSPQTLAIGLAAVKLQGKDAELLKAVLPYGLVFLVLMSAWATAGCYLGIFGLVS